MKRLIFVALTALSSVTFARSHVCAGERLYASDVRIDSGVRPIEGTVTGSHIIVFDKEVLVSQDYVEGLIVHGAPPYKVSYLADQKVLEEITLPAYLEKTYRVTAVLNRVDSSSLEVLEEIGRETVVCRDFQKFVP